MESKKTIIEKIFKIVKTQDFRRLGRCFTTRDRKYFYDTGTGKVFSIEDNVFYALCCLLENQTTEELISNKHIDLEAVKEIYNCIQKENILLAPPLNEFIGPQVNDLDEQLKHHRAQITLELTERCNLRCKYCIYNNGSGYRNYGTSDMTFDVARKAIDDLIRNSGENSIYVSFYGGEPLLKFDIIKKCIEYCESVKNKEITCAITTNATLLSKDIAHYFYQLGNKIHITLSLDGPRIINDRFRVYPNGEGSFEDTTKGLKNLLDAFENKEHLSLGINSVLADPTPENLDKIEEYFKTFPDMPDNVVYTNSFVATQDKAMEYLGVDSEIEKEIFSNSQHIKNYFDPLFEWATSSADGEKLTDKKIAHENMVKELALIHKRLLFDKPMAHYYLNGCCVPGARRVYVTTKGEYLICEKIGPSPSIGNVENGLDVGKIKEFYVDKFCEQAKKYCKDCWAIHLCGMCYMNCYDNEDINFNYRHSKCIMNRLYIQKYLELYHEILEHNPESLRIIDSYEIV